MTCGTGGCPPDSALDLLRISAYARRMIRYFDMADHDRLPWRFTRESRSVLARLA
jgi:hypothetical protein